MAPRAAGTGLPTTIGRDIEALSGTEPLVVMAAGATLTGIALLLEDPSGNEGFLGREPIEDCGEICDAAFELPLLGGAGLLWAGGALAGAPGTEETGRTLTEGILLTYGAVGVLKLAVARPRPDGSGEDGFPSAHAAGTACAAAILWDRWGAGAGIPAAAVAGFTALSRISLGRHYPSDVIAGAAIGLAVGLAASDAHDGGTDDTSRGPVLRIGWDTENGLGIGI